MCIHTYIDSLCLYFWIEASLDDQSFLPFFQDSRLQCVELFKLKEICLLCQEQCWFIVPEVEPSVPLQQTSLLEAHLKSSQSWAPFLLPSPPTHSCTSRKEQGKALWSVWRGVATFFSPLSKVLSPCPLLLPHPFPQLCIAFPCLPWFLLYRVSHQLPKAFRR